MRRARLQTHNEPSGTGKERHQAPDDILQELVRVEDRTMGSLSQTRTDREIIVLFHRCSSSSTATVCLWERRTNCSFPAFTGLDHKATVSQPAHHDLNHKPTQDPNLFIMPQIWLSTERGRAKWRQFTQSTGWLNYLNYLWLACRATTTFEDETRRLIGVTGALSVYAQWPGFTRGNSLKQE